MKKVYTTDQVSYGFAIANRKWRFNFGHVSFFTQCNGVETAHKVASIINGSIKRLKRFELDGLARNNIARLVNV